MSGLRERLATLVSAPEERIDVAQAALVIAQEEYPRLDINRYVGRLDDLAAGARAGMRPHMAPSDCVAWLNQFLFVEHGFVGNDADYYDPRNSFLNDVIDRRTGIPITLSVVYCEVARRLELPVCGVSFPGHFLAKYIADPEIIIDPFFGTVISAAECAKRLRAIYGPRTPLDRRFLRPATAREILVRILSNLKQVYIDQADWTRALACVDRILLLVPDLAGEVRDRGILYQRLECYAAALRDLERYLQMAPDDETAPTIRAMLPELRGQAARLQ